MCTTVRVGGVPVCDSKPRPIEDVWGRESLLTDVLEMLAHGARDAHGLRIRSLPTSAGWFPPASAAPRAANGGPGGRGALGGPQALVTGGGLCLEDSVPPGTVQRGPVTRRLQRSGRLFQWTVVPQGHAMAFRVLHGISNTQRFSQV